MADNLIPILSPDGQPGTIPADQLSDALGQGFSLPRPKLQATDLTPNQKGVNVFSPDGVPGIIPLEQLHDAMSAGYTPVSFYSPEEEKIKKETTAKLPPPGPVRDFREVYKGIAPDTVYDENHNLKVKTLDGQEFSLPVDDAAPLLAARQIKLANPAFAAVVENHRDIASDDETGQAVRQFMSTAVPGARSFEKWLATSGEGGEYGKVPGFASYLGEKLKTENPTAQAIGTAAGVVGMFGTPEVRLGQLAKAATVAKLAPEGAGIARTVGAHALGTAIEGAIITSPQAIAQAAIDKNPKAAAETLGLGLGIGGVLGLGGGLISGAEKAIPIAKANAIDSALTQMGVAPEMLEKLGNAEQKEKFVQSLLDHGLTDKSKTSEFLESLQKMSEGEGLTKTLNKLDPYLEGEASNSKLQMQIASMGEKAAVSEPKITQVMEELSGKLGELSDKAGNITLSNLGKFVQEIGEKIDWKTKTAEDLVNGFRKEVQQDAVTELMNLGDKAAANADAKLAAEWTENKYVAEMAKQIHTKMLEPFVESGLAEEGVFKSGADKMAAILKETLAHGLKHKGVGLAMGALGLAHGGPVAGLLNYAVGQGISKIVGKLLDYYAENSATKLGSFLKARATHPAIASYLAVDAIHSVNKQIERIPDYITDLSRRGVYKTVPFVTHDDPIKKALGSAANGLSKDQQYNKLVNQIHTLSSNPELRQTHIAQAISPFAADHSQLAKDLADELNKKIEFLSTIAPKTNDHPLPFKPTPEYKPSAAEYAEFQDNLRIAQNPLALLNHLAEGKVTAKQVAIASQLNPEVMRMVQEKMQEAAYSGKADLTYQQRLSASLIMGQAMDNSLNQVQQLQQVYGPTQQASAPAPPPKRSGKGGTKGFNNVDKMPGAQYTQAQRLGK